MTRRDFAFVLGLACVGCEPRQNGEAAPVADTADTGGTLAAEEQPIFEIELWPGEGIPVLEGARDTLVLHQEPLVRSATTGTLAAAKGRSLPYDSTRYQTIASARAVALDATQLQGRDFGTVRILTRDAYTRSMAVGSVTLARGDTIEYLQPRAEGTCFVRAAGSIWEIDTCVVFDRSKFSLRGEPSTRWWVYITLPEASGWLPVSDSTANVVKRTF
jgi:hypothetical protein